MPPSIASHSPQAPSIAGLFFLAPNTPSKGASIVGPADWSVFASSDDDAPPEWSEEEIVFLHWRLLQDVQELSDPAVPLDDKLATLRWVFTESDKDHKPFSFVNCLRVVGCSPLSPVAYCGLVDCEAIRDHIANHAKRWLLETLARYPAWVREVLSRNPEWVEAQLARNPQWINEQIKKLSVQGDLFA